MRSLLLLVLLFSSALSAQSSAPELTAADRRAIAEAFAARVENTYAPAEPAKQIAAAIREHVRRGDYDAVAGAEAFAERLTRDARAVRDDAQLRVAFSSQSIPADHDAQRPATAQAGGGAHPAGPYRIHERFVALVPAAQPAKTNGEGAGVQPAVAAPAADALKAAAAAPSKEAAVDQAAQSPARDLLEAWIKSFNEHDLAARRAWLRANTTMPEPQIDEFSSIDLKIREGHGAFEIVQFLKIEATTTEALLKHAKSGNRAKVQVLLDPNDPKKIGKVGLAQVKP